MHLSKGTEIILLEGALLVLPAEVWVAEIHTCRHGPATGTDQVKAEKNWTNCVCYEGCVIRGTV